jgi:hypothetical protein
VEATTRGNEAPWLAAASPYQEFARFCDRVMGEATNKLIERNFERSRRRYGIGFDSAADIGCGTGRLLLAFHATAMFCTALTILPQCLRKPGAGLETKTFSLCDKICANCSCRSRSISSPVLSILSTISQRRLE